jgi:predicted ATPase
VGFNAPLIVCASCEKSIGVVRALFDAVARCNCRRARPVSSNRSENEGATGTLRSCLRAIAACAGARPREHTETFYEPETSLHPDLLPALGRLIAGAAKRSQVLVVSHAARLIATLEEQPGCNSIVLEKQMGETRIAGPHGLDVPAWNWPPR